MSNEPKIHLIFIRRKKLNDMSWHLWAFKLWKVAWPIPAGYSVLYAYYQGKPSLPSDKSLLLIPKRLECSVLYITFASDMSLFILLGIWEARHFFVSWNKSSQTWVTFPMAVTTISSQTSELFAQRDSTKVWVVNYRRRVPPPPHNMFPVYFLMQTKKVWESIDNVLIT